MKKRNIILISALIFALLSLSGCKSKTAETKSNVIESNKDYITASGVIEAENQYTVTTSAMADILSANFEEGDNVKVGQTLYILEQEDIQNNISKSRNALEQAELSLDQANRNIAKLSVKAGANGTVTGIYVNDGEMIAAGTKVADVINDSQMKLTVPFISSAANNLYVGESASISVVGTFYTGFGNVSNISSGEITLNGSKVKMVEITIQNPGTLKKGDKGTAEIGNFACNDVGTFDYYGSHSVISEVAGRVSNKNVKVGDSVGAGSTVVTLYSDAYTDGLKQSKLSVNNAKLALSSLENQLDDYNIKSKINGTVIKKNVKLNDTLSAANMGNMAVIADLSKIILKVNVDEMDVKKIYKGMKVEITADADQNTKYNGIVEKIAKSGTDVNNVALYEVQVYIKVPRDLMPGMNVTAKFNLK